MKKLLVICVSFILLVSCTSTKYVPVVQDVPTIPVSEYSVKDLIQEPETVYDLMHNSVIYEHEYYRWHDYALILLKMVENQKIFYTPI